MAALVKKNLCPWESQKSLEEITPKSEAEYFPLRNVWLHFEKFSILAVKNENGKRESDTNDSKEGDGKSKKPRYQGFKEDPFNYIDENDSVLKEVMEYFDIKVQFFFYCHF